MGILEEMRRRRLFCDGGMGSLLQARGLKAGELPERWNVSRPEVLTQIHREYLEAGADLVLDSIRDLPEAVLRIEEHLRGGKELEPLL